MPLLKCSLLSMLAVGSSVVFDVDNPNDLDGACPSLPGSTVCTYRTALQAAIDHQGDRVVINMPDDVFTITRLLPSMYVRFGRPFKKVIINGFTEPASGPSTGGTILDGGGAWQLLLSQPGMIVNVSNILFRNGAANSTQKHNGGAIDNGGTMDLKDCDFENNFAYAAGGAISNSGTMTITTAGFRGNRAQDGGAILSSRDGGGATLTGTDLTFFDNHASHTGGAIQNAQSHLYLTSSSFLNHSAGDDSLGGTLYNGVNARMVLKDCDIILSHAGSGGLVANAETSSMMVATNVHFSHGTATRFQGGSITSKGTNRPNGVPGLSLAGCTFNESMAYSNTDNPQGATLSLTAPNATAKLVNCSIDGRRAASAGDPMPTEIYLANTGADLNMTFVNVTSCHRRTIYIEPNQYDQKIVIRGGKFCEDSSYTGVELIDATVSAALRGCDDEEEYWQCGARAHCNAKTIGATTVGLTCACPRSHTFPDGGFMWGYAYGGGDFVGDYEIQVNSSGFDGCFEQWDDKLVSLNASASAGKLMPAFSADVTEYAACTLRDSANHLMPVTVSVNSTYNEENHGTVAAGPITSSVNVSAAARDGVITVNVTAFDQDLYHAHETDYLVRVRWLDGDAWCKPGAPTACLNETGGQVYCVTQTKYPIDYIPRETTCDPSGSVYTPACGSTKFGATCLDCPICVADKDYACDCPINIPDGVTTCNANGTALSECDCSSVFAYPPFAPPPSAPPPSSPPPPPSPPLFSTVDIILMSAGGLLLLALLLGGLCFWRRRQRIKRYELQNRLLGPPSQDPMNAQPVMTGVQPLPAQQLPAPSAS